MAASATAPRHAAASMHGPQSRPWPAQLGAPCRAAAGAAAARRGRLLRRAAQPADVQAAAAARPAFAVREAETAAELRAAGYLRAHSFYTYPPDRSEFSARMHRRMKGDAEWESVTRKVNGTEPSYESMTVVCLVATLPDVPGCPVAERAAAELDPSAKLPADAATGAPPQLVVGSVDVNRGAVLPAEDLVGRLPPVRRAAAAAVAAAHGGGGAPPRGRPSAQPPADRAHTPPRPRAQEGQATRRAYLSNVCVASAAQRRGIAAALLTAAEARAAALGVAHLYVHVVHDNAPARGLYARLGYEAEAEETEAFARALRRPRRLLLHKRLAGAADEQQAARVAPMAATAQDSLAPLRSGEGKKDEDREEETEYSPFYGIEKGAVLQEARIFHDPNLDPRRCSQVITKLLYLLHQGETFTKKEASDVFFAATKLFQARDPHLRRMVYLVLKDICPGSDEVIIVTSSLMKDMNAKVELYRSNAVRVLCQIVDGQLLAQIERYLKQAVVDKSAVVAASVLVSALHLIKNNGEIIKRWVNEVQEAVTSKHPMVQFHAVALLHALRATDRLAVSKLVSQLTRGSVRSPLAQCLLVRYVSQVIADSQPGPNGEARPFYDFLESCLRHKAELVIFEAARAICNLRDVSARELQPAITVLQLFLSSSKPVLRFAAVRTLNKVAMSHPMAVTNCNIDMESLITDQNRSIATLAITTLLKTGNEGSVDKLLKTIGGFMADIPDDFKVVVVGAIRSLAVKFPAKHRGLMAFLANVLREEGGFEYKKAIVAAILAIIQEIPDARESGLGHLCEFIEDCEFTFLSVEVLHLLGQEGPTTKEPARYIRYIYNRIILENATVRAAAVSALASFGARCPELTERVVVLLRRALYDNDDEVRDRATLHLTQLGGGAGGPDAIRPQLDVNLAAMEAALRTYLAEDDTATAFDVSAVPKAPPPEAKLPKGGAGGAAAAAAGAAPGAAAGAAGGAGGAGVGANAYEAAIKARPEFAALGPLFKSCAPVRLTEEDTEYVIHAIKHIFPAHLVLQFDCTNTIAEQRLENVTVLTDLADAPEFEAESALALPSMPLHEVGQCYTVLRRGGGGLPGGKMACVLRFTVKEIDPGTGEAEEEGYEDEYQLEDVEVSGADYIRPLPLGNFRAAWEEVDPGTEREDDYGLGPRDSLQDTVETVMGILGMQPHTVLLAGALPGDERALVRLSFGLGADGQVAMKVVSRGDSEAASEAVHAVIQEA
ncbi:Coatomer subunit gamma [Scenedesmus sp. PABB004]|nr:Coatomer subunit gamma [Scenedesmus sp. PABB004]